MNTPRQPHEPLPERARWDDLEAFQVIYIGVQDKKTIEEIGHQSGGKFGTARTLYRRLARLEKALDTQLIHRERWSRATRVTPAGERLQKQLQSIALLKQRLEEEFRSDLPTLRIVTISNIAVHAMSQVWSKLDSRRYPLTVQFQEAATWLEALDDIQSGVADMGIFNIPADKWPPQGMRADRLTESMPWPLMVHRKHPFARRGGQPVRLEELKDETVVVQSVYADLFKPNHRSKSLILVSQFGYARPLVRKEVAVAPWCQTAEYLQPTEDAVIVPLKSNLCCQSVIVYARHFPLYPAEPIKSLIEEVKAVFQKQVSHTHTH